ncbi:hypothetical protein JCM11641_005678 [Rhodosporidiobolus odoratus]
MLERLGGLSGMKHIILQLSIVDGTEQEQANNLMIACAPSIRLFYHDRPLPLSLFDTLAGVQLVIDFRRYIEVERGPSRIVLRTLYLPCQLLLSTLSLVKGDPLEGFLEAIDRLEELDIEVFWEEDTAEGDCSLISPEFVPRHSRDDCGERESSEA